MYVTGVTCSADFPTLNSLQSKVAGDSQATEAADVFVTKLDSTGNKLIYSTYIGGSGVDLGMAIAVDSQNNAYVAGNTTSTDFPLAHPFQKAFGGAQLPGMLLYSS